MKTIHDVLEHFIKDLHSAARQQLDLIPDICESNEALSDGLWKHFQEIKQQLGRLNSIGEARGYTQMDEVHCKGMEGLIKEARHIMKESEDAESNAQIYALVGSLRRIKQYEVAGYSTVLLKIDNDDQRSMLESILGEAKNADTKLIEYVS